MLPKITFHIFHIHQIHFLLLDLSGVPVAPADQQYFDVIQVPYWSGNSSDAYPSVKLRMDFCGPIVGVFLYHCHILGHEDRGMMATIEVVPPNGKNINGQQQQHHTHKQQQQEEHA